MSIISTEFVLPKVDKLTCRACLKSGGIGIMHSFTDTAGHRDLRDLYQQLTKIEVKLTDKRKPTLICGSCTSKLIAANEFIEDAQRAENLLLFHIKSSEIPHILKQETDDINFEVVDDVDREGYTVEFIETESEKQANEIDNSQEQFESLDTVVNEVEFDCEIAEHQIGDDSDGIYEESTVMYEKDYSEFELLEENYLEVENLDETTTEQQIGVKKLDATGSRLTHGSKHQIKCDECPRSFAKVESFLRHKSTAHTFAPREEIFSKQRSEQNILCPFCPRTFVHKNDLVRHVNAIHPEDAAKSPIDIEPKTHKRQYKKAMCPHCEKEFPQASIKIHIRRHLGINPYKCETCLKAFPRKQDLTVHIRQHTGEKPHVCSVCGKSFIRPNKLSRHMRIHLGIRPYTCDDCGKSFSQSNDLKIHRRRHTGEKPYQCYCGDSFISGTALRQHRKLKMHNEGDVPDPYDACRVNTRCELKRNENTSLQNTEEIFKLEEING